MEPEELAAGGLRYDVTGPVATITLDRPEVRNAQTPATWRALARIGAELSEEIRVVVLRGAGQSFSAGLDRSMLDPATTGQETVAGLLAGTDEEVEEVIDQYQRGFTFLRDPSIISIAAVQGYAIGAGFQLALACDLRVAAEDARFCMKESALGLVPDLTGTKPLVEAVGYARALEICVTARMVDAPEAERIGLVSEVVPGDRLQGRVAEMVESLCAPLPGVARSTKALLQNAQAATLTEQRHLERRLQVQRMRHLAELAQG